MKRAWHLNNYQSGFHARSVLLKGDIAKMVMKSFPGKKGYSDPVLDVGMSTLVFNHPVKTRNLRINTPSSDGISYGCTEKLIPYRWFHENWDWNRIFRLCETGDCLKWNFSVDLKYKLNERFRGEKYDYHWRIYIFPKRQLGYWNLWFSWAPLGTEFLDKIGIALEFLLKAAGLSSRIVLKNSATPCKWVMDIFPRGGNCPSNQPEPELPIKPDGFQIGDGFRIGPVNPNEHIQDVELNSSINLSQVSFEMVNRIVRAVLDVMKPANDSLHELNFRPAEQDILLFREWAKPRFGSPWVQEIWGWAVRTPSPDDIDDSLSDWTLLPVAHFKILGSWRIVTVVKEPGGWRFHVTGKYTKDPLKHRHIRDELARKAGMTSETLWEPQEVGQGWLGVPG